MDCGLGGDQIHRADAVTHTPHGEMLHSNTTESWVEAPLQLLHVFGKERKLPNSTDVPRPGSCTGKCTNLAQAMSSERGAGWLPGLGETLRTRSDGYSAGKGSTGKKVYFPSSGRPQMVRGMMGWGPWERRNTCLTGVSQPHVSYFPGSGNCCHPQALHLDILYCVLPFLYSLIPRSMSQE